MSIKNVVSVILRSDSELYLMQLRDNSPSIVFPGQWGLFGGTIEPGESSHEAAFRELKEEIYFTPEEIHEVLQYVIGNYHINVCTAKIDYPLSSLQLHEGSDFGMFSREEIFSGSLYSQKFRSYFRTAPPILGLFQYYLQWAQSSSLMSVLAEEGIERRQF